MMQALKRHKLLVLISFILVVILVVSIVVYAENSPQQPALTPSPSPSPTAAPSSNAPAPSATIQSPAPTRTSVPSQPGQFNQPTPPPASPIPGEITQYQGQTLTALNIYQYYLVTHPEVNIAGAQHLDRATYQLAITGLVGTSTNYTYAQITNDFAPSLQVATLPCVEGWSVTFLWQGVPIADLLQQTGVSADANTLIFVAADGYTSSLPLKYVTDNNLMVAYKINNITLTDQTGWPLFLVANNQYGYKWVEWITEINVSNDTNYLGYWESRGYPNDATVGGGSSGSSLAIGPFVLSDLAILVLCVIVAVVLLVFGVWRVRSRQPIPQANVQLCTNKP